MRLLQEFYMRSTAHHNDRMNIWSSQSSKFNAGSDEHPE